MHLKIRSQAYTIQLKEVVNFLTNFIVRLSSIEEIIALAMGSMYSLSISELSNCSTREKSRHTARDIDKGTGQTYRQINGYFLKLKVFEREF